MRNIMKVMWQMEKISEVLNTDCLAYMKTLPDKYFGLTIADPPFAVKYARGKNGFGVTTKNLPTTQDLKWDEKIHKHYIMLQNLQVWNTRHTWTLQALTRHKSFALYANIIQMS